MRRARLDDLETVSRIAGIDCTGFLSNPLNVCLLEGDGEAFFGWHEDGIYEVHCHFAKRGKDVREVSERMLARMRYEFGAKLVYAPIPDTSRHVKTYVRWLGFRPDQPIVLEGEPAELFKLEM